MKFASGLLLGIFLVWSGTSFADPDDFDPMIQKVMDEVIHEMSHESGSFVAHDSATTRKEENPSTSTVAIPNFTLEECLQRALRENLSLQAQHSQVRHKEALASASFRDMLPDLSLSSSRSDVLSAPSGRSEGESYNTTLTLSQPIYRGKSLLDPLSGKTGDCHPCTRRHGSVDQHPKKPYCRHQQLFEIFSIS